MALSSGCSPLGSFLIVFRVFSFWKVYVIHVKKKACALEIRQNVSVEPFSFAS